MRNLENYKNNRFKSLIFSLILFLIITTGLVTVAEAETTAQFDFSDIYNADTVYGNDKSGAFDSWAALITGTVAENNGNPRDDGLPDDGVFPSTSTHPRIELAKFHTDDGFNAWQSSGTGSVTANVTNGQYKTVHLIASAGGAGTNNPAKFEVVLHYSDDTTDRSQEFTVPDWYGDISDPGYALKDNMDRWSNGGNLYENSDDPAIWGFAMQADSTKTLESITIDVTANEAGSFNFFGGAATTQETDVIEKPRISSFELTNPSDKNLAVNFDSDKQLSVISVSITGAESATFTGTNFTEADNGDGTYTYEATYNSNSDGDYTATLEIAEDAEGNDGASGEQDSVNIDTTPPQITGFKVSNPSGQNLLLNFTSNEDLAAISVSISGAESATFTGAYFTETDNADGTYTYETIYNGNSDGDYTATLETAEDAEGNDGASGEEDIVNIDTTPPVINAVEFPVNSNTGDIVGIGFNVNDNIGITSTDFNISTNNTAELTENGNWYNYTLNVPVDSVDDIVFNATFSDGADNFNASSDKTISVSDNIDPVIQDIVYEENVNTGDVVAIGFNVNDNIGITSTDFNISTNETAELTNDGNWYNYTLNVPVDSVNDIDFNATFSDAAGNFNSTDDISVNVSDNIDPVIQDIVYEENVNTGDIVGIGFNVNDNIGIASTDFNISTNETAELTEDGNWYNYTLNVPLD
ncbi:autotransporter outer membrane beta-barrel domain-containing protein, partial [Methanohalophilus portucalensis]